MTGFDKKSNDDDVNMTDDDVINAEAVSVWFFFAVTSQRLITTQN